jgi:hypothetical protein
MKHLHVEFSITLDGSTDLPMYEEGKKMGKFLINHFQQFLDYFKITDHNGFEVASSFSGCETREM